jgi:predicted Zn-dependent protease
MEKRNKIKRPEIEAAILLGPTRAHVLAILLSETCIRFGYSREAESNADVTGSDICAEAGYNPWGLVWLFREFENADVRHIPSLLSGDRITTLERHMRENPAVFASFNSDPQSATPLSVPKDAAEQFLR